MKSKKAGAQQKKAKLAVWKFASCDGCQLSLLDLEDELLLLANSVEIAFFLEASSRVLPGPYDVSLVEGSITTREDQQRIQDVRKQSKTLISIGACATSGGIQALRNFADVDEFTRHVYATPAYIQTLTTSSAISEHVAVDYELRGCPVNKYQLVEVLTSTLHGKAPSIPNESVCMECKRQGQTCVIVANNTACLGPITHAGCGAICPRYCRGCYGCYGPKEQCKPAPLSQKLLERAAKGSASQNELARLFRTFNCNSTEFRAESLLQEERAQKAKKHS